MQSAGSAVAYMEPLRLDFGDDKTIQERFVKFHKKYPKVYDLFRAFAIQLIKKGHKKIGARMIIERIRWEFATTETDERHFKINNCYIAHYSRVFINEYPEFADFIETRKIKNQ